LAEPGRIKVLPLPSGLMDNRGLPPSPGRQESLMSDQPDRMLRLPEVLNRTGLSRSTLYRKVEAGTFPHQIQISTRCAAWRQSAVEDWLRNPVLYHVDDTNQRRAS
jgi:prophage regulatory protein